MQLANGFYLNRFQSTLSMRRATCGLAISPRELLISIHALHEESDNMDSPYPWVIQFQSTLSMRRATNTHRQRLDAPVISIHALHEESDRTLRRGRH